MSMFERIKSIEFSIKLNIGNIISEEIILQQISYNPKTNPTTKKLLHQARHVVC